ncbi:MAG: C40 family peptidase [Desulfovibrionaceae bacterium]|nr:C40 family peptidase [Desulfovibrionaceae bacterium]
MLTFVLGLFLYGCSGKQKSTEPEASNEKDLFVEYSGGDFPENYQSSKTIRTLKAEKQRSIFRFRERNRGQFFTWNNHNSASDDLRPGARRQLLRAARSAIGTPYVVGGTSPGGFDCSGLVCWAYGNVGVKLPRTAREQSVVGRRICNISDMREGDIVAFHHPKRGYHTGIYVGDGKFIHSPRRKTRVKINSLDDPYFHSTFLGARRINLTGREDLLAQAEKKLNPDYSYEASLRRFKREEFRTSRNASRDRSYSHRLSKRELAELKKELRKGRNRSNREELSKKSSRKERLVATAENTKKGSKREKMTEQKKAQKQDRSAKKEARSDRHSKKEQASKSDKKNKAKQVTAYDGKGDKKHSKSDKKKKSSSKS